MSFWEFLTSLSVLGWMAVLLPIPLLALAIWRTVKRGNKPLTPAEQKKQFIIVTIAFTILVADVIHSNFR